MPWTLYVPPGRSTLARTVSSQVIDFDVAGNAMCVEQSAASADFAMSVMA